MPVRKVRKTSAKAEGDGEGQLSNEQHEKRKRLFMQQFEKEAQDRLNEMDGKMEQILATVERVCRVEMMKMPPAMLRTRIKDLMCEEDTPVGEVTIAIKNESTEINQPLTRKPSKKGQTNASAPRLQRTLSVQSKKATKEVSRMTKSRSLANAADSFKTPRVTTTQTAKRTRRCVSKISDPTSAKTQERSKHLLDPFGTSSLMATATVSTSGGETLLLSNDVKDHIDIGMLDDMAVLQMQQLRELMDYLCKKVENGAQ
ncbi:borealin-2 [Paramormyrops kingsleyae]|uniref:Cell division cycle associated 9 n=1 Tax=Paramormyrops kingsleyae TaxID=1676925 RepID=A0A3B3RNE5_9TELE|nr:borealin-2-like [Paramormyrops kingsleyae]